MRADFCIENSISGSGWQSLLKFTSKSSAPQLMTNAKNICVT
jgi:hypothetical protein